MKKGIVIVISIIVIAVILIGTAISNYNSMVSAYENVEGLLANIDTQLQRRNDLIPNLVSTVQGYTDHESEVIADVADARSKLAGADTTMEKSEADAELTNALSRLLVVVESYPELKADAQFTALMDELSGTENRIAVARNDYNDAAKEYNAEIKKFPKVIFAGIFGFETAEYFEASEAAQQAPEVSFD